MNSNEFHTKYVKCTPEDDAGDWTPSICRSESYGIKNGIPQYLIEAAQKAGKQYNELTGTFEPMPVL